MKGCPVKYSCKGLLSLIKIIVPESGKSYLVWSFWQLWLLFLHQNIPNDFLVLLLIEKVDQLKHTLSAIPRPSNAHGCQAVVSCPLQEFDEGGFLVGILVFVNMFDHISNWLIIIVVSQPVERGVVCQLVDILHVSKMLFVIVSRSKAFGSCFQVYLLYKHYHHLMVVLWIIFVTAVTLTKVEKGSVLHSVDCLHQTHEDILVVWLSGLSELLPCSKEGIFGSHFLHMLLIVQG